MEEERTLQYATIAMWWAKVAQILPIVITLKRTVLSMVKKLGNIFVGLRRVIILRCWSTKCFKCCGDNDLQLIMIL